MSKINLLPWRAELRARQKKQFLAALASSAALGLAVAALVFFYYSSHVSGQQERNKFLEDQIALGEKKIEEIKDLDLQKQRLVNRKSVIDTLQGDRSRVVRLFESLVKSTPDGVVLTLVKQNESSMVIEGRAQSNTRVSTYLRNLEASGWMKNPDLSVIEATATQPGFEAFPYEFKLSVGLAKPDELQAVPPVDAVQLAPTADLPLEAPLSAVPAQAPAPASSTAPASVVPAPTAGPAVEAAPASNQSETEAAPIERRPAAPPAAPPEPKGSASPPPGEPTAHTTTPSGRTGGLQ